METLYFELPGSPATAARRHHNHKTRTKTIKLIHFLLLKISMTAMHVKTCTNEVAVQLIHKILC
jgi:hypothetical protein